MIVEGKAADGSVRTLLLESDGSLASGSSGGAGDSGQVETQGLLRQVVAALVLTNNLNIEQVRELARNITL